MLFQLMQNRGANHCNAAASTAATVAFLLSTLLDFPVISFLGHFFYFYFFFAADLVHRALQCSWAGRRR